MNSLDDDQTAMWQQARIPVAKSLLTNKMRREFRFAPFAENGLELWTFIA
jgi:hypothetical protein